MKSCKMYMFILYTVYFTLKYTDNEHDTMYAVINKPQPPPLPPSYDIDHSTLYTTTIGEHGPVYDVATDYEEEGDKKEKELLDQVNIM